jgi:hypothetical protein
MLYTGRENAASIALKKIKINVTAMTETICSNNIETSNDTFNNTAIIEKVPLTIVQSYLGRKIRCTLSDGRTAEGVFICIDRL